MAISKSEYEKLLGKTSTSTEDKDYGLTTSILAGVGSGVFKIFEGAATLGATLLDLGVDKNRAEAVEAYFDEINPFDEAAEATAAGKITEVLVNLGVPGTFAFTKAASLANTALNNYQTTSCMLSQD